MVRQHVVLHLPCTLCSHCCTGHPPPLLLASAPPQVKTITALTLAALAEAASPYGIESFDDVLEPLWRGIRWGVEAVLCLVVSAQRGALAGRLRLSRLWQCRRFRVWEREMADQVFGGVADHVEHQAADTAAHVCYDTLYGASLLHRCLLVDLCPAPPNTPPGNCVARCWLPSSSALASSSP